MSTRKVETSSEDWESGRLGRSEPHAKVAPAATASMIDDSLGLQMISIRLQKDLIEDFKRIADLRGIGYQPLMRDALKRFMNAELKKHPSLKIVKNS